MADVDASAAARIAGSSDGRMVMAQSPACPGADDSRSTAPKSGQRTIHRLLCAGLLCGVATTADAGAPFAPVADVPDYVLTMNEHTAYRRQDAPLTVTRHGGWTRVDTTDAALATTTYYARNGEIEISLYRGDSRGIEAALFRRGKDPDWETLIRNTGERRIVLGETCTVWRETYKSLRRTDTIDVSRTSCVTDDGIELSYKLDSEVGLLSEAEATRFERRKVTADEVRPPWETLTLGWWERRDAATSTATAAPDYEAVLRSTPGAAGDLVLTTRRHHPWTYEDEVYGNTRRKLIVANRDSGLYVEYWSPDAGRRESLKISRTRLALASAEPPLPEDKTKPDRILGETCVWSELFPGMMDAGRSDCRTPDGILLKQLMWWRGGQRDLRATHLSRRPLSLGDVMPPAEILDPKYWGLD